MWVRAPLHAELSYDMCIVKGPGEEFAKNVGNLADAKGNAHWRVNYVILELFIPLRSLCVNDAIARHRLHLVPSDFSCY